jgi:glycosyltransferase involved in cell wall biosynthesis
MKVLITVPRLELAGGVANYYRILRPHLDVDKVFFEVGARPGEDGLVGTAWRFLVDFWRFHRMLSRDSWDLVHINPSMVPRSIIRDGLLMLIARAHGRRVLVFFRGWDPVYAARIRSRWGRLFRAVYGQAAAFIVLGAEFQAALESMGLRRPIFIATTVVDDALIPPPTQGRMATRDTCNILFLCRLDIGKGLPEAIDAFGRIQPAWPAATLTVVGDGPERAAAEISVASRKLRGVRFLGHIDGARKAEVFRDSDIYFFPTFFIEGMPNSLLEAMACGLPVITRPVGGIRDFFEDGRMGYVTESKDPAVFSEFLDRLIADPGLRRRMGDYNRDYARRHFAASVVVEGLLGIYEQVVRSAAPR